MTTATESPGIEVRVTADRRVASYFGRPSLETLVAAIICAAVLFNIVLAFLNANAVAISRGDVILGEILIVGAATIVCIASANRLMIPWFAVLWLLATILIAMTLVRQSFDPKYYRDVLLIPVFIALGMTFAKGNIVKLFAVLQAVVLAVMIFEAVSPEAFVRILSPWHYYVNTRDFAIDETWHPESGLYLSALRPRGRFLGEFLGIHRLSSIFLEPVSLGNWCVIVAIFTAALWGAMSWRVRAFFMLTNVLLLIGSDGRLAFVTILLISIVSIFAHRFPRYIYFLYLPSVIIVAIVLVAAFGFEQGVDDFPSRVALSVDRLMRLDIPAFLGIDHSLVQFTADSGISYLLVTQSIFGAIILWSAICFLQPPTNRSAVVLMHGICIYIALLLMVSFSLFSIKSAAPLWFIYGYMRVRTFIDGERGRKTGTPP